MFTTHDFDEIVLNNPFLNDGIVGYSIDKLFWKYYINYDPDALKFYGQSNSTCKYILIESYFSKKTIKIIREDNEIVIKEFSKDDNYSETLNDKAKLIRIDKRLFTLKKIVSKQIKDLKKSVLSLTNVNFDIEAIIEFTDLIVPRLSKIENQNLINELENAKNNPIYYIENLTTVISQNATVVSQKILSNVLINTLIESNSLLVIDWKSPFEEVNALFENHFDKLGIEIEKKKLSKYDTTKYLASINDKINKTQFKMILVGDISDTFLITFTTKDNYNKIIEKALNLKFEMKEWNN